MSDTGSNCFEDRANLDCLDEIDWQAEKTVKWSGNCVSRQIKEGNQAEFLVERRFLRDVEQELGIRSEAVGREVTRMTAGRNRRPELEQAMTAALTRADCHFRSARLR